MNYDMLFRGNTTVRYALTGAKGGFARTLLAQTLLIPRLQPAVLCDLDIEGTRSLCIELGFNPEKLIECTNTSQFSTLSEDAIALVSDTGLIESGSYDILVEATGNPLIGYITARSAIENGHHVAMVSKEVDAVAGVDLADKAAAAEVVYTTADGDQPANLIGWISWARTLGLEIIAAGKSSEYDLVFDPGKGQVSQLDQTIDAPELNKLLDSGDDIVATLEARRHALKGLKTSATADYCEMSVVGTNTGLIPDVERLHYPIARTSELADIYALKEDGGILDRSAIIDVFNVLRLPDEASFAGGVFITVRTHDAPTWELLRQKGHVVSRNGRYACLYLPYHFMGVETPITLFDAVLNKRPSGSAFPAQHVVLTGRANQDIKAGTCLHMGGHHHDVDGVDAVLLARADAPEDIAPLYLMAHTPLKRDVSKGDLIMLEDLESPNTELLAAWQRGLNK